MRLRYWELIDRPVIAADGKNIGRLIDLVAGRQGDGLYIEALLVGPTALARRIGFPPSRLFRPAPSQRIPWSLVARVDDSIQLRVSSADLPTSGTGDSAAAPDLGSEEYR